MPRTKQARALPDFASEEEELEFWETHDPRDFDGGPADDIVLAIKPPPKKRITLWLDEAVIKKLKAIARRHDMPYQPLTRGLLRRAVDELGASGNRGISKQPARQRKRTNAS